PRGARPPRQRGRPVRDHLPGPGGQPARAPLRRHAAHLGHARGEPAHPRATGVRRRDMFADGRRLGLLVRLGLAAPCGGAGAGEKKSAPAGEFARAELAWAMTWDADWMTAVTFVGPTRRLAAGNKLGQIVLYELPEKAGGPAPQPALRLD